MISPKKPAFVLFVLSIISTSCTTIAIADGHNNRNGACTFSIGQDSKSILVNGPNGNHSCPIDAKVNQARLSSDGSALLISTNSYVSSSDLMKCSSTLSIHASHIPDEIGALADVSLLGGIYIGMIPVSFQPLSYLAVVAKIGSKKNLISLPGAYIDATPVEELQKTAFFYDEQAGPFPLISKDGRYVAIDGNPNCSVDSTPGVWEIRSNRKVVLSIADCTRLFWVSDVQ